MISNLDRRLRLVEDELAILRLAARFTDSVNERNLGEFRELWTPHGVWEIGPPASARAQGIEEVTAMLERLLQPYVMFMQMTHSGTVTLDGDRAKARFTMRERGKTERAYYENLAVYEDDLVRLSDGQWKFQKRSYHYRYVDDTAFAGQVFPVTERE